MLAEAGLLGKVEFTSVMSENEIKKEICRAFMVPMGLGEDGLAAGNLFPFHYLQRTGAGSRSLCIYQLYPKIFNGMADKLLVYARVGVTCTS